jgi:hypothetical protein
MRIKKPQESIGSVAKLWFVLCHTWDSRRYLSWSCGMTRYRTFDSRWKWRLLTWDFGCSPIYWVINSETIVHVKISLFAAVLRDDIFNDPNCDIIIYLTFTSLLLLSLLLYQAFRGSWTANLSRMSGLARSSDSDRTRPSFGVCACSLLLGEDGLARSTRKSLRVWQAW